MRASTNEGKTRTASTSAQVLLPILKVTIHMPTPFSSFFINTFSFSVSIHTHTVLLQNMCMQKPDQHTADTTPIPLDHSLNYYYYVSKSLNA